jgi:hypothetical protein
MAAPTNVRVESNSPTSAILRWTYSGNALVSVWRAPHGGAFTALTAGGLEVSPGTTFYVDDTAVAGTFYDYKLSDDGGTTFSSTVSVVIQTCVPASGSTQSTSSPSLPQFVGESDVNAQNLQQLSQQVEATLGTQQSASPCTPCPVNGALVIDCTSGCFNFEVVVNQDINSISVVGCPPDGEFPVIDFTIPPNTTRRICGFPKGFGFGGDECFQAPIAGGASGRTVRASKGKAPARSKPGTRSRGGASGGGGAGCTCTPAPDPKDDNKLTIKCCSSNCSLGCTAQQDKASLDLIACGGRPPYTWSKTGGITLNVSQSGTRATVKVPSNPGKTVSGIAYGIARIYCDGCTGPGGVCDSRYALTQLFQCNDAPSTPCDSSSCIPPNLPNSQLPVCPQCNQFGNGGCTESPWCNGGPALAKSAYLENACDKRTQQMIDAGCQPCGLQAGSTVTVTDSLGKSVSIVIRN